AWFVALGPVGWVIAAVALVATVVALNWDRVREWTARAWAAVSDYLVRAWEWIKSTAVQVWEAIKAFFARWWDELLAVFTGPIGLIVYLIAHNWGAIRSKTTEIWTAVTGWLSGIWQGIVNAVNNTWQSIVNWVTAKWNELQTGTQAIWTSIRDWLYGVWQALVNRISSVWETIRSGAASAWQKVKDTILGVWDGIKRGIAACVNKIIDVLNGMIREMNRISFTVPSWVPIIGGRSWGFNLPTIPYVALAEGGEITRPTFTLLGEQGRETVIPGGRAELAEDIAQAVYMAVRDAMRVVQATQPAGDREIVFVVDGTAFARLTLPAFIREGQRQGLQLVVRPQGV
ncbi:MAG: hypothetical protein AB1609_18730, partial [Bacillota bacterium]